MFISILIGCIIFGYYIFEIEKQKRHKQDKEREYIQNVLSNQQLSIVEKTYYEECKHYYRLVGVPLISISNEIYDNNIELISSSIKFGIDEDYNKFNLQEFLNKFCNISHINISDISITKIQRGSIIVEAEIFKNIDSNRKKLKIKMLYDLYTTKLQEELGKMKIFFMLMGDIKLLNKKQKYRNEIKLNPKWNHIYAIGHTYWNNKLDDGRDRGNQPYYCPIGWKRYSLYITDDFYAKFKGWCICYHGTKFSYGLSILLDGIKPARTIAHGRGIYVSPSINYACHPRYSEIKKLDLVHQTNFFNSGKYIQYVLECRVHPANIIKVATQTLQATTMIDSNINNDVIEWVINNKNKNIMDFNDLDASLICTGLMVRVTDNHPGLLHESQWWHTAHLCNNKACCYLGIDLNGLYKQKNNDDKCNIIYE
ncbi:unnamed protein product [Didymodactylos carnosus]|uniref:Uncharacterized protein n=1 Tax=Didymodactylos carnosus TaxID=1234261 RepID=A0A815HL50_9BILA|nr:unnamed protein product [Didymodactylos carnosus]CAF1355443.1 unnamed protein product [Didymodactylos carnosus]CAF4009654.1 unnamed protein product [Didymodactylos carnosus]CAF4228622.1 unnamed protein product [Didymodactylos carnosus]